MTPHNPNRHLRSMSRARCLFENPSQLLKNSESLTTNNHFAALTNVPVHDPGFTSAPNFLTPLRKCFAKPGLRRRVLDTRKRKSWDGTPERIMRDTRLSHYSARPTAGYFPWNGIHTANYRILPIRGCLSLITLLASERIGSNQAHNHHAFMLKRPKTTRTDPNVLYARSHLKTLRCYAARAISGEATSQ
jgi:hypothetical protein